MTATETDIQHKELKTTSTDAQTSNMGEGSQQSAPLINSSGKAARSVDVLLFTTFFKIGFFTLGGGYAMIPLIEAEVVDKNKWIGKSEFLDLIAVAQSCPGVFAINIATFIGYKLRGRWGAVSTSVGTALPSFLIILFIAMFFHQFMNVGWIAAMFRGIRPAVVALIAVPTFNMAKEAQINLSNFWIPIASALLIWAFHVNPIWIIIAAGVGGYFYGKVLK